MAKNDKRTALESESRESGLANLANQAYKRANELLADWTGKAQTAAQRAKAAKVRCSQPLRIDMDGRVLTVCACVPSVLFCMGQTEETNNSDAATQQTNTANSETVKAAKAKAKAEALLVKATQAKDSAKNHDTKANQATQRANDARAAAAGFKE